MDVTIPELDALIARIERLEAAASRTELVRDAVEAFHNVVNKRG